MLVAVSSENGKIKYQDAFPKEDTTGSLGAKKRDYSHLKVVVLDEDVLEEKWVYNKILTELSETEKFPRNTYVCVVDDVEDLFELEKNITQDVGTYFEEYIKNHEEKKGHLLTLGDLLDEKENEVMTVYFPYLGIEENYIIWNGYVNIDGRLWQE
jgi:hypothetical protein